MKRVIIPKGKLEVIVDQLYRCGVGIEPHVGNRALLVNIWNLALVGWIDFYYTSNGSFAEININDKYAKCIEN